MAHILISATRKSSGKTTVSLGLCAALRRRGLAVQPFKKGPDYIDPMWLAAAAGRDCHNLDFNTMSWVEIAALFARHVADADISVIESNNGLFDGTDMEGSNSNAAMAKLLAAPVVLVVDCAGMARGIAPLLMGYATFDPALRIGAVILNNVANDRHEGKLRAAVERYTDIPVLGAIHRDNGLRIDERHLGLVPAAEWAGAKARIDAVADALERRIDLDALLTLARTAPPPAATALTGTRPATPDIRIAVARDSAFGFYYAGDLEALRMAGAELIFFDTMRDRALPEADGLIIGGGFPETHLAALEANAPLRAEIRRAIEGGLPAYAECGGLMYLARSIEWQGRTGKMAGVIPAEVVVHEKPRGHGYMQLAETAAMPWPGPSGAEIPGHEFHYSDLRGLEGTPRFAYRVARGHGIDGEHDGLIYHNLLASYAHLRDTGTNAWTRRFVGFARSVKSNHRKATGTER